MSVEANKALVRRLLEDVVAGGRADAVDELVSPSFVGHAPAGRELAGREGLAAYVSMLRGAFPDLSVELDELFGEGDRVVAELTLRGTQRGRFRGVPATRRPIELPANAICRVSDGSVAELWAEWDQKLLLEQLGVLPQLIR